MTRRSDKKERESYDGKSVHFSPVIPAAPPEERTLAHKASFCLSKL